MLPEEPGPKVCASAGSDTPRNAEARVEAAISHNFRRFGAMPDWMVGSRRNPAKKARGSDVYRRILTSLLSLGNGAPMVPRMEDSCQAFYSYYENHTGS